MIPNYSVVRTIGHGTFGYVFEAIDNNTKSKVALKRTTKVGDRVSREYEILNTLKGEPNIVQLLEIFYSRDSQQRVIQNLVMEYCDACLEDLLSHGEPLKIDQIVSYTRQLFTGLKAMHSHGIAHRDLKPENILIKDGQLKIADFGTAKKLADFQNTPYVVSRYFRSPELILGSNKYTNKIDIWAAGCIIFELMTLQTLIPSNSEGETIPEYLKVFGSLSKDDLQRLREMTDLPNAHKLLECLAQEPVKKKDLRKLLSHSKQYTNEEIDLAADLIEKCLRAFPGDRVSAAEALQHPFLNQSI